MDKCIYCGNPQCGFPCSCEWEKQNPGNIQFSCEHCGIYEASRPKCNKCEETVNKYGFTEQYLQLSHCDVIGMISNKLSDMDNNKIVELWNSLDDRKIEYIGDGVYRWLPLE